MTSINEQLYESIRNDVYRLARAYGIGRFTPMADRYQYLYKTPKGQGPSTAGAIRDRKKKRK